MDVPIRRATSADAAEVARLLHDFNTEYEEPTPGVSALTEYAARLLDAGEITVLLGGEGPDAIALLRIRPSVWTGEPEAHLQELYVAPALPGSTSTPARRTRLRVPCTRAVASPTAKAHPTGPRCCSTSASSSA
jgi:hypothetical protein